MQRLILAALTASMVAAGAAAAAEGPKPITPDKKIVLFNGKDYTGWTFFHRGENVDPKTVWSIKDGVMHCVGKPPGYARTVAAYTNYKLHVEWRWATATPRNSGVLVHMSGQDKVWPKSVECQLMHRNAGDVFIIGTMVNEMKGKKGRRVPKKAESSEKPVGQWNTYEITCRGDVITAKVNGVLQTHVTGASVTAGSICLQSEGAPIEFRNVYVEPLGAAEETPAKGLDFTLTDQNGQKVSLSDSAGKIVVLEWMNWECPIWMRHWKKGTYQELAKKYRDQGVVWLAINSTHTKSVADNKKFSDSQSCSYPILDDHEGDVGRMFGAKTTPHMFIIKDGRVVYQGAIDDDPRGRNESPVNYVDKALTELLAGKAVSTPETKPYGCSVKYGKK